MRLSTALPARFATILTGAEGEDTKEEKKPEGRGKGKGKGNLDQPGGPVDAPQPEDEEARTARYLSPRLVPKPAKHPREENDFSFSSRRSTVRIPDAFAPWQRQSVV